jgi:hypothetical protein
MKQGYFVRFEGDATFPESYLYVAELKESAEIVAKKHEGETGKPCEIVRFVGEFYNKGFVQLYCNNAPQLKGYDYGDKYGGKPSERALRLRRKKN